MRPVSVATRLWVGLLALAGIAGAHALAFALVTPDPHARQHLLEETGHSGWYWPAAALLAATVAASIGILLRRTIGDGKRTSWVHLGTLLALMQVGGFIALEVAERSIIGSPALRLLAEPVFLIGVVAQIAVAALIVIVLSLVVEVIARFKSRNHCLSDDRSTDLPSPVFSLRPRRLSGLRTAWGSRGPPTSIFI